MPKAAIALPLSFGCIDPFHVNTFSAHCFFQFHRENNPGN